MSATISLGSIGGRRVDATLTFIQHSLIIIGLMLVLGTFKPLDGDRAATETPQAIAAEASTPTEQTEAAKRGSAALTPRLQRALDFVSRRYRVEPEALVPVFEAAQAVGRERRLDPLLIVAIIGIESRFNPFAESASGAQGLMQVMPKIHQDKLPDDAGDQPFLDPVTNIQVGVHVLEEAIRWRGSLTAGLQHYGGASDDPGSGYANKVLAEKERLEQAARRGTGART